MNNDRFKYRVWDNDLRQYVSELVFFNHHGEVCLIETGCFYQHKTVIEQCTGLKDEDGKLIYDGDIIWVDSPYPDGSRREVCWYRGEWNVDGEGLAYLCRNRRVKVIGNIHENGGADGRFR